MNSVVNSFLSKRQTSCSTNRNYLPNGRAFILLKLVVPSLVWCRREFMPPSDFYQPINLHMQPFVLVPNQVKFYSFLVLQIHMQDSSLLPYHGSAWEPLGLGIISLDPLNCLHPFLRCQFQVLSDTHCPGAENTGLTLCRALDHIVGSESYMAGSSARSFTLTLLYLETHLNLTNLVQTNFCSASLCSWTSVELFLSL